MDLLVPSCVLLFLYNLLSRRNHPGFFVRVTHFIDMFQSKVIRYLFLFIESNNYNYLNNSSGRSSYYYMIGHFNCQTYTKHAMTAFTEWSVLELKCLNMEITGSVTIKYQV